MHDPSATGIAPIVAPIVAPPLAPVIAAVVVTRDRPQLLQQVVQALQAQQRRPDRVIVVDNASGAATVAMLRGCGAMGLELEVVRSDTNLGGAGGFALGMRRALAGPCDWLWLLDDDAVPRPDALALLAAALAGPAEGAGAVAPAVREFGATAPAHRRRYSLWSGIEWALGPRHYRRDCAALDTASFVGLLLAARAAAPIGLPDAELFLSYDDTEYCLRLRRAGWQLRLVPASVIDHLRSPQARLRAGPIGPRHYFNLRNRVVVARRHARLPRLAGAVATLTGLLLWLGCSGRFGPGAARIAGRALADGWAGRLGG
jgi:rhamnopyranosyl-N-acetylglucosaminyl-diphospho-decaprenol beta-1,3/1,4-galactofuranosyltransferase